MPTPPGPPSSTASAPLESRRPAEFLLVATTVSLLLALVGIHGWHIVGSVPPVERIPWQVMVPIFAGFSFLHSLYVVGLRRTITYFILTCSITIVVEYVGVTTGIPFGRYHYTDVLGAKLFGVVPWVVPLAYFMMVVPAHTIANLIVVGKPIAQGGRIGQLVLAALLTAVVMTAWDLSNDPFMANELKAWVWLDSGPYFGIPVENFFGWTATVFLISMICRLIEWWVPAHAAKPAPRWFIAGALVAYGGLMIADAIVGSPAGSRVVPPFAMGIPLLAAFMRLYQPEFLAEVATAADARA
jgi:uncharacterized membrane protein